MPQKCAHVQILHKWIPYRFILIKAKVNKWQNRIIIWYSRTLEVPTLNFSSGPGQQAGQQCDQQEEQSWDHWPHRVHCLQCSIWSLLKQMISPLNCGLMFSLYQASIVGNQIHTTTSNCTHYVSVNSTNKRFVLKFDRFQTIIWCWKYLYACWDSFCIGFNQTWEELSKANQLDQLLSQIDYST